MDDWNDFGAPGALANNPESFASSSREAPYPTSSHSTLETFSDSSAALVDGDANLGTTAHPSQRNPPAPVERSSILGAIPFLSASRQRRATRAAAAAAAAVAAATVNAASKPQHAASQSRDSPDNPEAPPQAHVHPAPDADADADPNAQPQPEVRDVARDMHVSIEGAALADAPATELDSGLLMDDVVDGMSAASDSDAREPVSVMMPRPKRGVPINDLGEDAHSFMPPADSDVPDSRSNTRFTPRRGDLDDVPDDYELNIEGFHFARSPISLSEADGEPISEIPTSMLAHVEKSYIKLEVISAKQIRGLIIFFNVFLCLSLLYTLFLTIANNTFFKTAEQAVPLPESFLTTKQKAQAVLGPVAVVRDENGTVRPVEFEGVVAIAGPNNQPNSVPLARSVLPSYNLTRDSPDCPADFSNLRHPAYAPMFAIVGLYETRTGFRKGPVCPLPPLPPITDFKPASSQPLFLTPRQQPAPAGAPPVLPPPGVPISGDSPSDAASDPSSGTSPSGTTSSSSDDFDPEDAYLVYFLPVTVSFAPSIIKLLHTVSAAAISLFFLILFVLFLIRLYVAGRRNITHEQIWTSILILVTALYFNGVEKITDAIDVIGAMNGAPRNNEFPTWINNISTVLENIRDAAFLTFTYFYLWASFDSYRVLDPTQRLTFMKFYAPKLIILVPFAAAQVAVHYAIKMEISEVPLLTAPAMGFIFSSFHLMYYLKLEFILAVVKTIVDLILLMVIFRSGWLTMRALERAPYMKYRSKRVGFRFFLYINFVFYLFFVLLHWVLFFGTPPGELVVRVAPPERTLRLGLSFQANAGTWWVIVGYVICTAYVHLPHNCVGWYRGWFVSSKLASPGSKWSFDSRSGIEEERSGERSVNVSSKPSGKDVKMNSETWSNDDDTPVSLVDNDSELQQQIVEPITYRKRESKDSLELKANCFTMQTHVIMFNFAWYVYYYGTSKLENFRPRENPLPFEFSVDRHVKSDETDTQALVLDCTDRIIVTFKGTTSMKNLRTSIQLSQELLRNVVKLNADGEDESGRLKKLFGPRYMFGKIHKGFATAYMSVMDEVVGRVRALRHQKMRPVFLTGHSLGGALATICSLDLWVKLNISRREIFVSTFGSPRVGNAYFAAVYKEVVPLHWRIVVDPDMIAKLPRVGYTHVGKKVVLTPHGGMIIDPNALENRPWTGEAAGFAYHRKASYLLAMRAWCVRNHGLTYTPVFWPFPVRPEDERRFAGAFDEEDVEQNVDGRAVAEKIIRLDAMVDALGGGDDLGENNLAIVSKWGRLTRRLLLNDKLGGVS